MPDERPAGPDRSSVGSASLRAMHVLVDAPPHVLDDQLGLRLAAPDGVLHVPPGMEPQNTRGLRASIVARARFIEDLVTERAGLGVRQYVILGAGLDTFAQRRGEIVPGLHVFEVDRPAPQAWKRQRLGELGFELPAWLRLVPVDFEAGGSWWDGLVAAGYDPGQPAVVASSGVSMYLTRKAVVETLRQCARLAPGSTLVMSFALPPERSEPEERPATGAALFSSFGVEEMLTMAHEAGFSEVRHVSAASLGERYFAGRSDGLWPSSMQDLLVAST